MKVCLLHRLPLPCQRPSSHSVVQTVTGIAGCQGRLLALVPVLTLLELFLVRLHHCLLRESNKTQGTRMASRAEEHVGRQEARSDGDGTVSAIW